MARVDTNRNLVAALSYLPFFAIFLSIVILLVEKDDKFIRFHALQSFVISVGYYILNILINIIFGAGILALVGTVLGPLLALAVLVIWVVSMIKAYQGQVMKWPLVGEFAEKMVR
jgi:uncharacterized membrane protein